MGARLWGVLLLVLGFASLSYLRDIASPIPGPQNLFLIIGGFLVFIGLVLIIAGGKKQPRY